MVSFRFGFPSPLQFRAADNPGQPDFAERPLTMEALGGGPVPEAREFSIVDSLEDAVARYDRAHATVERLSLEADQSDAEAALSAIGPFLIAVALALRITKVTGELRLERRG